MVLFVFALIVPGVLLGIIVRNKRIMKEYAYKKWEINIFWITLLIIEISGVIGVLLTL